MRMRKRNVRNHFHSSVGSTQSSVAEVDTESVTYADAVADALSVAESVAVADGESVAVADALSVAESVAVSVAESDARSCTVTGGICNPAADVEADFVADFAADFVAGFGGGFPAPLGARRVFTVPGALCIVGIGIFGVNVTSSDVSKGFLAQ